MRIRALISILLIAGLGSCYSPDLGDGDLECGPERACPDGYECHRDGRCHEAPNAPPTNQPRELIEITGGGGHAAGAEREAHISIGQPVVASPVTSGERTILFGLLGTTSSKRVEGSE